MQNNVKFYSMLENKKIMEMLLVIVVPVSGLPHLCVDWAVKLPRYRLGHTRWASWFSLDRWHVLSMFLLSGSVDSEKLIQKEENKQLKLIKIAYYKCMQTKCKWAQNIFFLNSQFLIVILNCDKLDEIWQLKARHVYPSLRTVGK